MNNRTSIDKDRLQELLNKEAQLDQIKGDLKDLKETAYTKTITFKSIDIEVTLHGNGTYRFW